METIEAQSVLTRTGGFLDTFTHSINPYPPSRRNMPPPGGAKGGPSIPARSAPCWPPLSRPAESSGRKTGSTISPGWPPRERRRIDHAPGHQHQALLPPVQR